MAVSRAQAVVEEMLLRGVLPDLLPPVQSTPAPPEFATFLAQGAQPIAAPTSGPARLLIWQIPAEFAQRPAEFDAFLNDHIPSTDHATLRWLRLSPRYLGPQRPPPPLAHLRRRNRFKLIDVLGPRSRTEHRPDTLTPNP